MLLGNQKKWVDMYRETLTETNPAISEFTDKQLIDMIALMLTPTLCAALPEEVKEEEALCRHYCKGLMALTAPDPGATGRIDPALLNPTNNN